MDSYGQSRQVNSFALILNQDLSTPSTTPSSKTEDNIDCVDAISSACCLVRSRADGSGRSLTRPLCQNSGLSTSQIVWGTSNQLPYDLVIEGESYRPRLKPRLTREAMARALALGLVTSRIARPVRSRRSQISTAIGTTRQGMAHDVGLPRGNTLQIKWLNLQCPLHRGVGFPLLPQGISLQSIPPLFRVQR